MSEQIIHGWFAIHMDKYQIIISFHTENQLQLHSCMFVSRPQDREEFFSENMQNKEKVIKLSVVILREGLPLWLGSEESICSARGAGFIPGWGRSPDGGNGNPLQYSCLESTSDRGARWATVHRVAKSQS